MGSLSHSEISINTLREECGKFLKMPFPKSPKNDRVREIFSEFVQGDGHVAGIVSSFLQGTKVNKKFICVDESINVILDSIKPADSDEDKELMEIRKRKDILDFFINMVLGLYDKE